jgi:protease-4
MFLRTAGNLLRLLLPAPHYVQFVLAGEMPTLPPVRRGLVQRFLPKPLSLMDLERQLDRVARDRRVKGVVLHLHSLRLSWAAQQSVRDAVHRLQRAGKRVVAWATAYDTTRYHIACACDTILLQPGGRVAGLGIAQRYLFLADALRRIGIEADFLQISPYKTAPDIFMRTEMSEEAREMANWLIGDLFDQFVDAVASGRGLTPDEARAVIDGAPYIDGDAVDGRLVDQVVCEKELPARLSAKKRRPARIATFRQVRRALLRPHRPLSSKRVGIIRIAGDIIDGRSSTPPVKPPFRIPLLFSERAGDLSVVASVRRAAKSRRVGAVVVHVDSGGGSATSSEAMAAALRSLASRKPLVVSFGGVAASGGYYVATPGQWIVSQPGTITGSIGVLTGKLVNAALLEKLHFGYEWIERGDGTALFRSDDPFTEEEREKVWKGIRRTYELFLQRVSEGRGKDVDAIDAIGGGRVWTGRQALDHGLVDAYGGLQDALGKARSLAGLHPRTPAVEIVSRDPVTAPAAPRASEALTYASEGLQLLRGAAPLCLLPLALDE